MISNVALLQLQALETSNAFELLGNLDCSEAEQVTQPVVKETGNTQRESSMVEDVGWRMVDNNINCGAATMLTLLLPEV